MGSNESDMERFLRGREGTPPEERIMRYHAGKEKEGYITVANKYRAKVIVVPMAAADIQFLLADEIEEVFALGYASMDGTITWKYGKPADEIIADVERALIEYFEVGEFFRG